MKNKIFDCITFFKSNLLFEIRFHTLKNYVDYFVICEGTKTHNGNLKKLNFDLNKWNKYKDKIIYIIDDNMPNFVISNKKKTTLFKPKRFDDDRWLLVRHQMERLHDGIKLANKNDFIIFSDEDEIPNPNKINSFNFDKYKYGIFMQNLYYYKLNLQNTTEWNGFWPGSRICQKKNLKSFFDFRILDPSNAKKNFWRSIFKEKSIETIYNGGWHFTYLMNENEISEKIRSSAHIEFNSQEYHNVDNIKKRIKYFLDPFERDNNNRLKKVEIDKTYPEYIKDNILKYKEWIV